MNCLNSAPAAPVPLPQQAADMAVLLAAPYAGDSGELELTLIAADKATMPAPKARHVRPQDMPDCAKQLADNTGGRSGEGWNVYVGAALRNGAPAEGRAKSAHVIGTGWLWLDFDDAAAAEAAPDRLAWAGLDPAFTVLTGREPGLRLHCWIRLSEMIDGAKAQRLMQALGGRLAADRAPTDPPRVMRLAGCVACAPCWTERATRSRVWSRRAGFMRS